MNYGRAECDLCAQACPETDCISFADRRLVVDNDRCNACGVCTTVCPTGAFTVEGLSDTELLAKLQGAGAGKDLLLTCSLGPEGGAAWQADVPEAGEPGYAVRLPCLAIAKEAHYASLILSGTESITLDCRRCHDCNISSGKETIDSTVSYARTLLSLSGRGGRLEVLRGHGAAHPARPAKTSRRRASVKDIFPGREYSRREIFGFLREKAVGHAMQRVSGRTNGAGKDAPGAPAAAMTERRYLLIKVLGESGLRPDSAVRDGHLPLRSMMVTEDCTVCGRCVAFCPTGALSMEAGKDAASVLFDMSLCMRCNECIEFCPSDALRYEESFTLGTLLEDEKHGAVLMKKELAGCQQCGQKYLPGTIEQGCPRCARRTRLDERVQSILFGS